MREWVGWVETPPTWWGERWRHSKFVAASPSYIKRGRSSLSLHTLAPLSVLPLLHLSAIRLAKPWPTSFYTTPSRRAAGDSDGSTTSDAPLDRGNGGHHQAVRVTEYGVAARCSAHLHDLEIGEWTTSSSTRIILETLTVFEGEFSWNLAYPLLTSTRLDLGVLAVLTVGIFCFLNYKPISGIRAVSMHRCFAWVEHIWVCGRWWSCYGLHVLFRILVA